MLSFTPVHVLCRPAESVVVDRFVCSCAEQAMVVSRRASGTRSIPGRVQKDRPQKVKVRPRTALERAPSLTDPQHAHPVRGS